MTPSPTGILRTTLTGVDLEIVRAIPAPRADVWATLTDSDRTALWFGPWERLSDNDIRVQMVFEDGEPWMELHVEACLPEHRLAVSSDGWDLEAVLTDNGDGTLLTFIHHRENTDGVGEIGPGWEYYLDLFVASRNGAPVPKFDDYYPSQQEYYTSLSPT